MHEKSNPYVRDPRRDRSGRNGRRRAIALLLPEPGPYYAPPVIVTAPWPNPIDALVGGALAIPGVVLGGLFGAIAPPPVVSCVGPDGSLFPCPAGPAPAYPAYPANLRRGLRRPGAASAAARYAKAVLRPVRRASQAFRRRRMLRTGWWLGWRRKPRVRLLKAANLISSLTTNN